MAALRDDEKPRIISTLGMTEARRRITEAGNQFARAQQSAVACNRAKTKPYWVDTARDLREKGLTFKSIAALVGRSAPRVYEMLRKNAPPRKLYKTLRKTQPDLHRQLLRRAARDEAQRTQEPVEEIYKRYGVATIDRSRAWDTAAGQAQSWGV